MSMMTVCLDILQIDNRLVRESQINRLKSVRSKRDKVAVSQSLNAITEAAKTGKGNLLELAVVAARNRATHRSNYTYSMA